MQSNTLVKENAYSEAPEWAIKKELCWNDYVRWGEGIRVELFDGLVYMMSAPDEWHQWVVFNLGKQLDSFFKGRKCTPYIAPFDVRLFPKADGSDNVVFQPDIFVVCDSDKVFNKKYCHGAPDFILEVMSKASAGRDLLDKKFWYEKAGVEEYWVVSLDKLYVYTLVDGHYTEEIYNMTDISDNFIFFF